MAVDWEQLLGRYGDWDVATMRRIVGCESGGDHVASLPDRYGVSAYGPFQIYGEPEAWYDDAYGARRAHEKFLANGYGAWSSSRNCWG